MKKMKLQMLGLSVNDLLSREQMKKVMGGSGGGSGAKGCSLSACQSNSDCTGNQNCRAIACVDDNGITGSYNICLLQ